MKLKKVLPIILTAVILVLQCLPFSVKLIFAGENGERWEHLYSYFSMMPFGYATFGPILCAMLTCVTLAILIVYLFKNVDALLLATSCSGILAALLSASQFLYGAKYITPLAVVITVLLLVMAILSLVMYIIDKKIHKSY